MSASLIIIGFIGLGFIGGLSGRYYYKTFVNNTINPYDYIPMVDEEHSEHFLKNVQSDNAPKDNAEYHTEIPPQSIPSAHPQSNCELEPLSDSD
jgi:hypothetical protein